MVNPDASSPDPPADRAKNGDHAFDAGGKSAPRRRGTSLATVYNTLEALHRAGLCRLVPTPEARRWDAGTHDHVHLRIADEQVVVDLPGELGSRLLDGLDPELLREIERRLNVTIDGFSIQIEAHRHVGA